MNPAIYSAIFIFIILFIILRQSRMNFLGKYLKTKKKGRRTEMLEFAKRFIDKECVIYTFNSQQLVGTVKEVEDGAMLIENGGSVEAVNLDFVVRIREYPRKKNGKKKSVVLD